MSSITSPVNSLAESVDALLTPAGVTGIMKGAVGARSVSGGDSTVAAQWVAPYASTGTVTATAAATASTTILAANTYYRLGATIYNGSTATAYVKLGSSASTTSYTLQMAASSYYELPYGYQGIVTAYWPAANGSAFVTELT